MGIFRQFPYSNFHDMNMDQIIKICRELQDAWTATSAEWASYKDYIDNYFANLDVSAEVLEAIRALANSGELNRLIDPVIAEATTAWLNEHVTPTTPLVDDSLTISGAAADAKVVGDRFIKTDSDLANLATDGVLRLYPEFVIGSITNGEDVAFGAGVRMSSILTMEGDGFITCNTGWRYCIAYYDANDDFISQTPYYTGRTALYEGDRIRIVVRAQPDQYISAGTPLNTFYDNAPIYLLSYTQERLDELYIRALFNYQNTNPDTLNGIVSGTGVVNVDSNLYFRLRAEVNKGDVIKVNGMNYRSASYPLYLLYRDNVIVSFYHETVDSNTRMTKTLIIPEGVNAIVVNQLGGGGSIEKAMDNSAFADQINPIYTDTNNILWIGTSIPEGAEYPVKASEAHGYACINKSLGSSKLCFTNTHISGSDVNKGKCLTATVAELEALYRSDVAGGIITEETLNMWKNYSYENSILPYINGTNETQVSMIVLDHGYNDRATIHDQMQNTESIDWTSTDRATFTGAFKYLLNKIQEVNPFIKIVISGYFTNTVERLNFNYYSKDICDMQALIGDKYDISVMRAWEHTQINAVHVSGTNNYIANFNTQYGTNYQKITPDANGNITALQLYCPDGVHPHSDRTGNTNKRLNAVYTKLLAHMI